MVPKSLRKRLFGIPPSETQASKRGFHVSSPEIRVRLESIGDTFVEGYHMALQEDQPDALSQQLDKIPNEMRGFAYEGAAMALALLDFVSLKNRSRLKQFIEGPGDSHIYMAHVGAGWAWARLHRNVNKAVTTLDPLLGWLAVDGYGFHESYFKWPKTVTQGRVPRHLSSQTRHVFDQGVGRSLWFVKGADVEVIAQTIRGFSVDRQADLWSGIGLAATYAGGVDEATLKQLVELGHEFRFELAQGSAFAAKARQRAGNPTAHTVLACQILCARSLEEAAQITDDALVDLPYGGEQTAYELWRQRIQQTFKTKEGGLK